MEILPGIGCRGLDPIGDTESNFLTEITGLLEQSLQRARSDWGY